MQRNRLIQAVSIVLCIVCVFCAGVVNPRITASAGEHQLTYTTEAAEGLPPEVAVAIAMGALRGVAVDFLWIRANRLKESGKFYEAMQLSTWITKLQPRFPKVWTFQAWNMAYNISVATHTDVERWQWVEAGIRLLREQGIPRNPNDMDLHRELAWIFLHKVAGNTDNVNRYYKQEMARRWHIVLGEPPETKGQRAARLDEIAVAPDTLDELFREIPEAATIYQHLNETLNVKPGEPMLELIARLDATMYRYSSRALGFLEGIEQDRRLAEGLLGLDPAVVDDVTAPTLRAMRSSAELQPAWDALMAHLRKRVLIDTYNMEPARMARYTEKYGPLDWRCAGAHALYWGQRGVEVGLSRDAVDAFDQRNTDRIVLQSIQEMRRYGEVDYDILTSEYLLFPDLRFLKYYEGVLLELMARDTTRGNAYNLYRAGYFNMLRDAIRSYYAYGDIATAQEYLSKLNREAATYDDIYDHWMYTELEMFIAEEMKDRFVNSHVVNDHVRFTFGGAFQQLVRGDFDRYRKQMAYAQTLYQMYEKQQHRNVTETAEDRMALRPLGQLMTGAFLDTFSRLAPFQQVVLYRSAPSEVRTWAYGRIYELWVAQFGNDEGFFPRFPKPAGYDQWRELSEDARRDLRERGVEDAINFERQ
ncbi:MAG: hypothetical protein KAS72_10490 [Phycisphaerales bacterium]|nr:hypothetical protein [Phycisphaerales bacterium]